MTFLENYEKNRGGKYEKLAFNYLVNDLLKDNLTGDNKQREITGLNMEQDSPTNFVPSMFYIFAYFNGEKNVSGKDSFYDMVPMILCTDADTKTITGINFNFVPNDVRAAFLDIITDSYSQFYNHDMFDDGFRVNEKLGGKLIDQKNLSVVLSLLKEKLGVDLNQCIRTYNRKRVLKSRMIEMDMWQYIPFLSFKDAVRGINLAKVQLSLIQPK